MTATARLKDLAAKLRLTCTYGASHTPDDEWRQQAHGYRCTLQYKGRQFSFDFWMGPAHTKEPDVEGCLDCLLSDAQGGGQSFADFCGDFGYDVDSRKAEATWKACQKSAKGLRKLLGRDFETFLYADRN